MRSCLELRICHTVPIGPHFFHDFANFHSLIEVNFEKSGISREMCPELSIFNLKIVPILSLFCSKGLVPISILADLRPWFEG